MTWNAKRRRHAGFLRSVPIISLGLPVKLRFFREIRVREVHRPSRKINPTLNKRMASSCLYTAQGDLECKEKEGFGNNPTKACMKPMGWCLGKPGAEAKLVDCAGNGVKGDWVCTDSIAEHRGTILRSDNCRSSWPNAPKGSCKAGRI